MSIQVKIPAGREIRGQLNFIYVVVKGEVSIQNWAWTLVVICIIDRDELPTEQINPKV